MYSKIQPQQINLHTFSSPSGHFTISQGSDYVYLDLNKYLTGDFNFTGNILINGSPIFTSDTTNVVDHSDNLILLGSNNTANGTGNVIVNSISTTIHGTNNLVLNSFPAGTFDQSVTKCTILAGTYAGFNNSISGSTILKDQSNSTSCTATKNNALYVSFVGGSYFDGNVNFSNSVSLEDFADLKLASQSSGLFSGDINVLGNIYWKNTLIPSISDVTGISGSLQTQITNSGALLTSDLDALEFLVTGTSTNLSGKSVFTTGDQTISGIKTFYNDILLSSSSLIGDTGISNFIQFADKNVVNSSGDLLKIVSKDSCAILIDSNDTKSGDSNFFNGDTSFNNSFVIGKGFDDLDGADPLMAVDYYGNLVVTGNLILKNSAGLVPTGDSDAIGTHGAFVQKNQYLYIKNNNTWMRFSGISTWDNSNPDIIAAGYQIVPNNGTANSHGFFRSNGTTPSSSGLDLASGIYTATVISPPVLIAWSYTTSDAQWPSYAECSISTHTIRTTYDLENEAFYVKVIS